MESVFIVYMFLFGDDQSHADGLECGDIMDLLDQCQMPYREEIARFDTIRAARDFARTLCPSSVRKMYGGKCTGTEFRVYLIEEVIPNGDDIADVLGDWDFYADDLMTLRDQEDMTVEWLRELEYDARHGDEYAIMALADYWDQFDEVPDDIPSAEELEQIRIYNETCYWIRVFDEDDTDANNGAVGAYEF